MDCRTLNGYTITADGLCAHGVRLQTGRLRAVRRWVHPKCKAAKARTLLEHEYVGDCGPGRSRIS